MCIRDRSDVASMVRNLHEGSSFVKTFAPYIPLQSYCTPAEALLMVECSEYAYTGYTFSQKVSPLKKRDLPESLKMADYDELTGQLHLMNGFKVWLGKYLSLIHILTAVLVAQVEVLPAIMVSREQKVVMAVKVTPELKEMTDYPL